MTNSEIQDILKMRMNIYAAGINAGAWKDINTAGASDMMAYLFPKSGQLAYYQLMMEQMRVAHSSLTGGVYFLFKMPVQIEKEISDYLRKEEIDLNTLVSNPSDYLLSMDSIPTDHSFTAVCIGAFSVQNLDSLLRLCASHYRYSFENNIQSYPYFE
jgi:hypothetical protein